MDAQPERRASRIVVPEGEDRSTAEGPAIDPAHGSRATRQLVGETKLREDRLTEWLEHDPRTDRSRVCDAFDDLDFVAIAGEEERSREARGSRPNDADPHGARSLPITC
jgi:hypothetical protein